MDKIAEYFNATPTQLFGTSKEIELEKSVLESNEYSDKVSEILKAVKYIEDFLETDGQYLEDLLYLTRGNQLYTEDGDELYIDPTSQKRTFHNQYEPGFIVARDKSPLELLIENKELREMLACNAYAYCLRCCTTMYTGQVYRSRFRGCRRRRTARLRQWKCRC